MLQLQGIWIGVLALHRSQAFFVPQRQPSARYDTHFMCICIDCARVTDCAAYHFVETKHEQPHMNENPQFMPRDGSPTIHVNIRTHRNDKEMQRIWKEHEEETKKAEAAAGGQQNDLRGETKYNLSPSTTIEYDVVKCADFVEDKGCWVRNMPEEIKKANPNFVPT